MDDHRSDLELVEAALNNDASAAQQISSVDNIERLQAVLRKRGATQSEASDIVGDLMGECFGGKTDKPPLLLKYNGQGSLGGFLTRAALNKLIDYKRRGKFQGRLPTQASDDSGDDFDRLAGDLPEDQPQEDVLLDLIRDALSAAFQKCDPEGLLIMRLVAVHNVRQDLVGIMLGWSQSKVSRAITNVMDSIREETMNEINEMDPWLELDWEDFIGLCRTSKNFFVGILE